MLGKIQQTIDVQCDVQMSTETAIATTNSYTYQPFIDGLRAVAVIAVVASHVGIQGFRGGFVGVDIFFVISGFLIIGQVVHDFQRGIFSFANFWAKRILRIIPPLLAMLSACCFIAPFVFETPSQFREFSNELSYSAAMLVNHYFLYKQDYFDIDASLKPLLHIWSLAIEEQFYLLAPLAIWGVWRVKGITVKKFKNSFPVLVCVLFFLSFLACIHFTQPEKNYAFYVMLCRAWEFIAGGAIIYFRPKVEKLPRFISAAFSVIGMALIAFSIWYLNDALAFPSYYALLPVSGAAMVITAGIVHPQLQIIRLLALSPFVAIGLVSYGWYLWHWPLLSFTRIYNFGVADLARDGVAVTAGLAMAVASYFFVERPSLYIRRMKLHPKMWSTIAVGSAGVSMVLAMAGVVYLNSVALKTELSLPIDMRVEKNTKAMAGDPCWMTDPEVVSTECLKEVGNKPVVLLIGDSHARMLYPALKLRIASEGMALISLWRSGCSPFDRRQAYTSTDIDTVKCAQYAERGIATLQQRLKKPPAIVLLGGYWAKLVHRLTYSEYIRSGEISDTSADNQNAAQLANRVSEILAKLEIMRVGKILLIGSSGEFVYSTLDCVMRARSYAMDSGFCDVPSEKMNSWIEPGNAALKKVATSFANAVFVDTFNAFCDGKACNSLQGTALLFPDTHHASEFGAELLFTKTHLGDYFPDGQSRRGFGSSN
jgi:peptidoglycan/LPS O-acetylase OafA/YrhL